MLDPLASIRARKRSVGSCKSKKAREGFPAAFTKTDKQIKNPDHTTLTITILTTIVPDHHNVTHSGHGASCEHCSLSQVTESPIFSNAYFIYLFILCLQEISTGIIVSD